MTYYSESASKLFSRTGETPTFFPIEEKLLPNLTSSDIVEICGKSGCGKTELLYHLIVCCVFPSSWKGLNLGGLGTQVFLIDNDCHFNLFRLVTIIENRITKCTSSLKVLLPKEELFSFIQDILKSLYIVHCYDAEEYLLTLNSFENKLCMQNKMSIIMIDGLSSFYWSDKARFQNNLSKLSLYYKGITELIIKISKSSGTPVIATRRKLLSTCDSDDRLFGKLWKNVSRKLKMEIKSSVSDRTEITLLDTLNSSLKLCSVSKYGFAVLEELHKDFCKK